MACFKKKEKRIAPIEQWNGQVLEKNKLEDYAFWSIAQMQHCATEKKNQQPNKEKTKLSYFKRHDANWGQILSSNIFAMIKINKK